MNLSHFLADDLYNKDQITALLALAKDIKANPQQYQQTLSGKSVAMIFEKPSLRTHVSFDIGINKLGGHALYLGQQNGKLGERERVSDYAKNLSRWADVIVARVFEHEAIVELGNHASVPVINALCDKYHPCQALADFVTLSEQFADLSMLKLAYVGDGNNVSNSLMIMAATLGVDFTLVCPGGHGSDSVMIDKTKALAAQSGSNFTVTSNMDALNGIDVIYTDTWVSMGDEGKVDNYLDKFMPYQINHDVMATTGAKYVMHCQPAHLDEEITTALFDSEMCLAFEQAENRMWAQNAVLVSFFSNQ
ncbi:ornithine carbamoyltransferase [Thalassotalea agarivorans]|uniref:Ornithine carbamoyltransferase n=1 Tax=Thalassotalea agarivorans TaxID=349064 RepID=A0A1I0CGT7_THASX|nr:ornithine carbamoyltransferase [Thalassotalea agarivorans]SET18370.1 ornithine carbamoyltransferase [Thalassotalea agarivorans]